MENKPDNSPLNEIGSSWVELIGKSGLAAFQESFPFLCDELACDVGKGSDSSDEITEVVSSEEPKIPEKRTSTSKKDFFVKLKAKLTKLFPDMDSSCDVQSSKAMLLAEEIARAKAKLAGARARAEEKKRAENLSLPKGHKITMEQAYVIERINALEKVIADQHTELLKRVFAEAQIIAKNNNRLLERMEAQEKILDEKNPDVLKRFFAEVRIITKNQAEVLERIEVFKKIFDEKNANGLKRSFDEIRMGLLRRLNLREKEIHHIQRYAEAERAIMKTIDNLSGFRNIQKEDHSKI